ncbi:hypothetical protein BDQ17DRAFT_1433475 [Cyathus striatus]|nr:hypothetical protein BDQ17DRAFT_1433475 [Cyathus striatus]
MRIDNRFTTIRPLTWDPSLLDVASLSYVDVTPAICPPCPVVNIAARPRRGAARGDGARDGGVEPLSHPLSTSSGTTKQNQKPRSTILLRLKSPKALSPPSPRIEIGI